MRETRETATGIEPAPPAHKGLVLIAVCLGQFMIQLDLTIVNVALPSISAELGAPVSTLQWVVDGYNVALASLMLLGGRLGDRSGHKRVYLAGLALFAVGSGLCALAPTSGWLIGARVVQGIGAAIELPATLAILSHTFVAGRERAQAVGLWTGAAGTSLVVGPVLGGALIAWFGWRAVFIVNLPVAVVIGLLVLGAVSEAVAPDTGGLDLDAGALASIATGQPSRAAPKARRDEVPNEGFAGFARVAPSADPAGLGGESRRGGSGGASPPEEDNPRDPPARRALGRTALKALALGLDLPGQVLGTAALALTAAGVIEGGRQGFTAALPVILLAAGGLSLIAFVGVERRRARPLLPLSFFRRPAYAAANADGLVMGFVTIGLLFLFGLFFQQVEGNSALVAGLRFLPLTVAFVLAGPLVGRVIERVGPRIPIAAGCALMGLGSLLLLRVGAAGGYLSVAWPFAIVGIGYGLTSTPMAAAVLAAVPPQRAGMASSTNLTARVAGGVLGVAILGALLPGAGVPHARESGFPLAFTSGLHAALGIAATVALAGAAAAVLFIRPPARREPDSVGPA